MEDRCALYITHARVSFFLRRVAEAGFLFVPNAKVKPSPQGHMGPNKRNGNGGQMENKRKENDPDEKNAGRQNKAPRSSGWCLVVMVLSSLWCFTVVCFFWVFWGCGFFAVFCLGGLLFLWFAVLVVDSTPYLVLKTCRCPFRHYQRQADGELGFEPLVSQVTASSAASSRALSMFLPSYQNRAEKTDP